MAMTVGGTLGVTFPDSTTVSAAIVNSNFSPALTDTANVLTVGAPNSGANQGRVIIDGTNGLTANGTTYTTAQFLFSPTISTSITNYNLRAAAVTAGWDQVLPLIAIVTVSSSGVIGTTSTATAGLIWTGSYPTGSTLAVINNGYILGAGGAGGAGGNGGNGSGSSGSAGGPAMQGNYAISITNNTTIGGGGIGGAGGLGGGGINNAGGGGGGGGGAGYNGGGGGGGGAGISGGLTGNPGGSGGLTTGGNGGSGGFGSVGSGSPGSNGGGLGNGNCTVAGTNAFITWVVTGTRLGTLG